MDFYFYPDEKIIFTEMVKNLPKNGKVVEWGCGGSTIKILELLLPTQSVISIEHDSEWYNNINNHLLSLNKNNWQLYHKPELSIWKHTVGTPDDENPVGWDEYILPTTDILDADIYLIDGVARSSIALMLLAKCTNKNAIILIHDANHRGIYYSWVARLFPKAEMIATSFLRLHLQ